MHYERNYKDQDREEADEQAIHDIAEYLDKPVLFADLVAFATCVEHGIAAEGETPATINNLNMTFGIAGISGYPFHAFARRYCLRAYREWMQSGPDAVEVDEAGFVMERTNG